MVNAPAKSDRHLAGDDVYELRIGVGGATDPTTYRKEFISFMNRNVGGRGRDWAIEKPRRNQPVIIARIRGKDKAALVKLQYAEVLTTKAIAHK